MKYTVIDRQGSAIAILEAGDHTDAQLFALRRWPVEFDHLGTYQDPAATEDRITAAFVRLGMTESSAKLAAKGRNAARALPLLEVPRQEASAQFKATSRPSGQSTSLRELHRARQTGGSLIELRETSGTLLGR